MSVAPPGRPARKPTKGTRHGNGVGQGDGWGGPARGTGVKSPPLLIPGCDSGKRQRAQSRREAKEARAEQLEDLLYELALHAERAETQIAAAVRLHAIYMGQPVARQINATVDDVGQLSDEELRAERERLRVAMGED